MSKKRSIQRNINKQKALQQEQIRRQAMIKAYYKNNLIDFIEGELGMKLRWWAKWLLDLISCWGFKNDK